MDEGESGGAVRGLDVAVNDGGPAAAPTRHRHERKRAIRKLTVVVDRFPKRDLEAGRALYPEEVTSRPQTREECIDGVRPCPYVGCQWHLYLDVNPTNGNITFNFPDLEPDELVESCSRDVAERGGATLEEVGDILNITREGARQLQARAFAKIDRAAGKLR